MVGQMRMVGPFKEVKDLDSTVVIDLNASNPMWSLLDKELFAQLQLRPHGAASLLTGIELVKEIKEVAAHRGEPVRVFVDGVEEPMAESVNEREMTVTRIATDDQGQALAGARGDEVVREVIAAKREIRIVRG